MIRKLLLRGVCVLVGRCSRPCWFAPTSSLEELPQAGALRECVTRASWHRRRRPPDEETPPPFAGGPRGVAPRGGGQERYARRRRTGRHRGGGWGRASSFATRKARGGRSPPARSPTQGGGATAVVITTAYNIVERLQATLRSRLAPRWRARRARARRGSERATLEEAGMWGGRSGRSTQLLLLPSASVCEVVGGGWRRRAVAMSRTNSGSSFGGLSDDQRWSLYELCSELALPFPRLLLLHPSGAGEDAREVVVGGRSCCLTTIHG